MVCGKFEMNWFDYMNNQFKYDGRIYRLYKSNSRIKLYTNFLFILNIRKPYFVSMEDIIDFIYHDINIDKWPDRPVTLLRTVKSRLLKNFPSQFKIINNRDHCYMLTD